MRKDECNRLQWSDINWKLAEIRIPGTKTEESDSWLPLGDVALNTLRELYESKQRDPACLWVFPGGSEKWGLWTLYRRAAVGGTDTPRTPAFSIARATSPEAFTSSMNSRRYVAPWSRPLGIPSAC